MHTDASTTPPEVLTSSRSADWETQTGVWMITAPSVCRFSDP